MATIYDVAKAAGVTATTVSNVLSGKGSVSQATKVRVMKLVQELGYQPNLVARSLIKGRTGIIGLVVSGMDNPFYAEITATVERLAYDANLRVLVTSLSGNESISKQLLTDMVMRRVDGIIVMCSSLTVSELAMIDNPISVVYCLWEGELNAVPHCISFNFFQGGQLVAEHLLALGHRRFGIVTHVGSREDYAYSRRIAGFVNTLHLAGYEVAPSMVVHGQSSIELSKAASHQLLSSAERPTAIFATNDLMAMGVLSAAWDLGLKVPEDVSLVGFDDIKLAGYTTPPLTTISIDKVSLIVQALEMLLKLLDGETVNSPPPMAATLKVRGSTGPYIPEKHAR